MFTECPVCQTMFRVTGAILRAGHGQVECGQCHATFDAIERLIDDIPPGPMPEPAAALGAVAAPQDSQPEGAAANLTPGTARWANDLPTGEFVLKDGELIPVGDRSLSESGTDVPVSQIVVEEPGAPEEITLEGNRIQISGVYRTATEWPLEPDEEEGPVLAPTGPVEDSISPASAQVMDENPDVGLALAEAGGRSALVWSLLSLLLAIGLVVQVVHHYRQELVRHPRLGPSLLKLYEALHLPLAPNWDLTGYEIRQWGVAADPAANGTLRLRASIVNRAGFAQPYPLLKLSLEDRWGEEVGAREFTPAEYLGPGAAANRLLAPNTPVNADIGIVDPGPDAVGFHVDVCLQLFSGLECASRTPGSP